MGRAAHIYSAVKIPLLTDAMERFQIAYESLPATILPPVLNPKQTYSPISSRGLLTLSPRSSVTVSPLLTRNASPDLGPGLPGADVLSVRNLSIHDARPLHTPPLPASSPSNSSYSSVATAFCITPPPLSRGVSCIDYNAPPPVFYIPPPTRDPPPPPRDVPPHLVARDQLISFNSAREGPSNGGSIVRNIARMIDNSVLTGADDPFVTRAPPKLRAPIQSPARLSPIQFPAELEDPVKQSELIPPPLVIRKCSGERLMCSSSAIVICSDSERKASESEVKRPTRVRPPRLPLNVIPSGDLNADRKKTSPSILAPQPKCVSPLFPSPMSMVKPAPMCTSLSQPQLTPSPTVRKGRPVLGSPFNSHPSSPLKTDTNSLSSWSTKPSPPPVDSKRAAEIAQFNNAVKWLAEHIPEDVAGLRKQIKHVADVQQAHRARNAVMSRSASFWTFSPVKPNADSAESPGSPDWEGPNIDEYGNVLRVETKAQRIERLRKEGWVIGFRSKHSLWKGTEYYDKLCETALAELGPTGMGSREWLNR